MVERHKETCPSRRSKKHLMPPPEGLVFREMKRVNLKLCLEAKRSIYEEPKRCDFCEYIHLEAPFRIFVENSTLCISPIFPLNKQQWAKWNALYTTTKSYGRFHYNRSSDHLFTWQTLQACLHDNITFIPRPNNTPQLRRRPSHNYTDATSWLNIKPKSTFPFFLLSFEYSNGRNLSTVFLMYF